MSLSKRVVIFTRGIRSKTGRHKIEVSSFYIGYDGLRCFFISAPIITGKPVMEKTMNIAVKNKYNFLKSGSDSKTGIPNPLKIEKNIRNAGKIRNFE